MKGVSVGLLSFVLIVGVIMVGTFGAFAWRQFIAPERGQTEATEQIQGNGDFRIQAYDHFFDLCTSIQGAEGRIHLFMEQLDSAPDSEINRIQTNLTAVRANRIELINRYNNDANRDWTVGQFRDSDLPYELSVNDEETNC